MTDRTAVTLANGLTLSCARHGEPDGAPVVFVPGPTDSWRSYESVLERLSPTVDGVAVSQRGHGDSDKPDRGYAVEDFAADVRLLLDALRFEQAVLAAHSGSCAVVRRAALDVPDRVAGLVLEASPVTLRGDEGLEAFVGDALSELEDPVDADFARSFVGDTSAGGIDPDLLDALVADVCKVPARVWREMFGSLLRYDDTAELGRIDAPTLLVWGDADALVGRDAQERLAAAMSNATLAVYPGVGHTPRWEDPARFAADVARFVDRI